MSDYYEDQTLVCRSCKEDFIHSGGEQRWMREKWGDDYASPTNCKSCRQKKREEKEQNERPST